MAFTGDQVLLTLAGLAYRGYFHLPMGFIPPQDKGYMIASIQLPDVERASE